MASTTHQYAKAAQSLAVIEGILTELNESFSSIQPRTAVDDAMIDALVASANQLAAGATALKSVTFQPPAP